MRSKKQSPKHRNHHSLYYLSISLLILLSLPWLYPLGRMVLKDQTSVFSFLKVNVNERDVNVKPIGLSVVDVAVLKNRVTGPSDEGFIEKNSLDSNTADLVLADELIQEKAVLQDERTVSSEELLSDANGSSPVQMDVKPTDEENVSGATVLTSAHDSELSDHTLKVVIEEKGKLPYEQWIKDFSLPEEQKVVGVRKDLIMPDPVLKVIDPAWKTIPHSSDYPTDDVIISTISVTDPRLGHKLPKRPSAMDCTATFQEAIDQVYAAGGGTVFVPKGEYLFRGELYLRPKVTLRGHWSEPNSKDWKTGSVLCVAPPESTLQSRPFLTMAKGSALQGVTFWYPEQDDNAVKPYPFTVYAHDAFNTILNITFVNAYRGLHASNAAMSVFRGIYGTCIETGFIAGNGVAFPRFEVIELSPLYWKWWPLDAAEPNLKVKGNYAREMLRKGVGFRLREMDGFNWFHGHISGYHIGLVTEDEEGKALDEGTAPHGTGIGLEIKDCIHAMQIRRGSILWYKSVFDGIQYGIFGEEAGSAQFNECKIAGGERSIALHGGSAKFKLTQSELKGSFQLLGKHHILVQDCDFSTRTTSPFELSEHVSGDISGCRLNRKKFKLKTESKMIITDIQSKHTPLPELKLDYRTDWNRSRRPLRQTLYNVKSKKYKGGAKGDGLQDDSDAVIAAIKKAHQAGGGIVFFPPGSYLLSKPLVLKKGVELRGASGSRYSPDATNRKHRMFMTLLLLVPEKSGLKHPAITLGDDCGVRGLSLFYPEQNWKRILEDKKPFIEYPTTIRAHGERNYIINTSAPNPYRFAEFDQATDFLVEMCLVGGIRNVFKVHHGSENGRIQTSHIKPGGFFGLLADIGNTPENRNAFGAKVAPHLSAVEIEDSQNIVVSGLFSRSARKVLTLNNASGQAVLIGGEQLQTGVTYEKAARQPFDLIECGINAGRHGDGTGKHAIYLGPNFKGEARVFGGHFGGTSDYLLKVMSGHLLIQDLTTPGYGYRAPRGIYVSERGHLTMERCAITRDWTLRVEKRGKLNFGACRFLQGFPVHHSPGVLDDEGNLPTNPMILSAPGQIDFVEQGLILQKTNISQHKEDRSWSQMLMTDEGFVLDVTESSFIDQEHLNGTLHIGLYIDQPCEISVMAGPKDRSSISFDLRRDFDLTKAGFHRLKLNIKKMKFSTESNDMIIQLNQGTLEDVRLRLSYVTFVKL